MYHTVQQGEWLAKIARLYGFGEWRKIYYHLDNAGLRRLRPNPNVLYPGDRVFIPDKEIEQESCETERRHRFQKKAPRQVLRIAVEGPDGNRMANTPYELVVEVGLVYEGNTNAEGLLEETIPADATQAKLTINGYTWDLKIGYLNPVDTETTDRGVSGAQARLFNLCYDVGQIDGILGPRTQAALKAFQRDYGLRESGELDSATRSKLVEIHGV